MSDPELAWAAAFIEGEGSVGMRKKRDREQLPAMAASNTDEALIRRFHSAVGGLGNVGVRDRTTPDKRLGIAIQPQKPLFVWSASSRVAEAVLEMILPYMTNGSIKQAKAVKAKALMNGRPRYSHKNEAGQYIGGRHPSIGPELGRVSNFATVTDLRHDLVQSMMFGTIENRGIDYVASIDCIRYANVLTAESMAYDFDVGRGLWLNRQRWTRLCRQYLDPSETRRFIDRSADVVLGEGKRGVITEMSTASITREAKKHRWGACCLGFTFRGLRNKEGALKPTISMHSRVSYVAYIGALDIALAYVLAKEVGKRAELPVEDFRFEWHLGSAQLHAFKSLPMLYSDGWMPYFENGAMRERYPAIRLISRWHDQIVDSTERNQPLGEIKYGPIRRVTRRYREFVNEDWLPSVSVSSLDLSPLYRA